MQPSRPDRSAPARSAIRQILPRLVALALAACRGADSAPPKTVTGPDVPDGANLRIVRVLVTQGAQDIDGSIPLVANMPAAVNVLVSRSRESVQAVPIVLRLFRGGGIVHTDTARTGGVLDVSTNIGAPSAQFLVPAALVSDGVAWQVEIDPAQTVADSTRADNLLPASGSTPLAIVSLPPFEVHFVPISLAAQGGATGNITAMNAEQYLISVRSMLPTGAMTFSVGAPLSVQASLGAAPKGGAVTFWQTVVQDVDVARMMSSTRSSTWYGVVPIPPGFTTFTNGGYAYIPNAPSDIGASSRSAVGLEFAPQFGSTYTRDVVAHEFAHTFGRNHAPGCGAGAPIDPAFPGGQGTIVTPGHDVWSWASGLTRFALSQPGSTGDVMSYCSPVWSSPYTWNAVLRWRQLAGAVVTSTTRTRATFIAGSIGADGSITLRPALDAEIAFQPTDLAGDVTVELRGADGTVLRSTRARSAAISETGGVRQFIAVMPASGVATEVVARTERGATAGIRRRQGSDTVTSRITRTGATEITSSAGNALLARDDATGDVIGIGWNGRVVLSQRSGFSISVSDGVRSSRRTVVPR